MLKKSDNKLLNELVKDCITYKLTETEALKYIELRYGKKIGLTSYKTRKAIIKSENTTQLWLNHFTRIGFVQSHQAHLDRINKIVDDSMHQLEKEISRKTRNEDKILKLKDSIMEATKLLVGLDMGSPIIAAIKAKLEQKEKEPSTDSSVAIGASVVSSSNNKKKKRELN